MSWLTVQIGVGDAENVFGLPQRLLACLPACIELLDALQKLGELLI